MSENRGERWNYRVLLGQGVANGAGYELTSEKLVLPFLYTAVGAPVFFAGLLVPIATVAKLAIQIVAAPMINAARSNKRFVAAGGGGDRDGDGLRQPDRQHGAGRLAGAGLPVRRPGRSGRAAGVYSLAFNDMLGRVLPRSHRSRLLFTQSGLAGIFAVVVALGSQIILPPGTSLAAHQELLWLGIVLIAISAAAIFAVREPEKARSAAEKPAAASGKGRIAELGAGFRIAFALPWFKHFVVARSLFLSIELAMPFYSIHAATFHGGNASGLSTFVIASSAGLVIGGFAWPRIGEASIRLVLALAAVVTGLGGVLALAIELQPALQTPADLRLRLRSGRLRRPGNPERADALSGQRDQRHGAAVLHRRIQRHHRAGGGRPRRDRRRLRPVAGRRLADRDHDRAQYRGGGLYDQAPRHPPDDPRRPKRRRRRWSR